MLPLPIVTEVPAARFARMTKGVNLSHWWAQNGDYSTERLRRDVTRADFDQLVRSGFRHVRLTLAPEALDGDGKTALLREKIEDAHDAGLAVIVDCHPEDGYKNEVKKDSGAWIAWWGNLAKELKGEDPNTTFFEPMNEPTFDDAAKWRETQRLAIDAIRKYAPRHTVIASGAKWSGLADLLTFEPYKDLDNVVYNFHFYDPFVFTHQGATWGWELSKFMKDVPYPSSPEAVRSVLPKIDNEEARKVIDGYGNERWNAQKIEDNLRKAQEWGRRNKVYVTCNEFGSYKSFAPSESRTAWIKDTRAALDKLGIGWTMWDYQGGFGAFSGNPGNRNGDSNVLSALGLGG
ncbi:cellulase family glycosylhydrolase [soil metagenome]